MTLIEGTKQLAKRYRHLTRTPNVFNTGSSVLMTHTMMVTSYGESGGMIKSYIDDNPDKSGWKEGPGIGIDTDGRWEDEIDKNNI